MRYSAWTDKFCPTQTQLNNGVMAQTRSAALTPRSGATTSFDESPANGKRFGGGRLYFGLGITAAIDRFMSFFLQLEFLPFPDRFSYEQRTAFADKYNSALLADNDHFVYGMAGITLKF